MRWERRKFRLVSGSGRRAPLPARSTIVSGGARVYATLGRACFEHRRAVLLSWLAVFVIGIRRRRRRLRPAEGLKRRLVDESVKGFNIVDDADRGRAGRDRGRRRRTGGRSPRTRGGPAPDAKLRALPQRRSRSSTRTARRIRGCAPRTANASLIVLTVRQERRRPDGHAHGRRPRPRRGQGPGARRDRSASAVTSA